MILSGRGGVGGGCKFPFTPSQWQELEHQALIFKYMVSGVPIPPDLLFTLKRSFLDSSSTSPHLGWSCFQMGLGLGMRKIDPEPGRCRRTDGKKWRCSKEAFQESKYCEKHMHRGKNRSRKPVEHPQQQLHLQHVLTTPSSMVKPMKHYSSLLSSSVIPDRHNHNNSHLYPPSYYNNIHPYHHSTQLGLHSGVDRRVVDEDGRSLMNGDSMGLTPSKMSSANGGRMIGTKEQHLQQEYEPYFQLQGSEDYESSRRCGDDNVDDDYDDHGTRREKTVYRFLEEWPPDNNNNKDSSASCSWLNLDDNKSSNCSSSSTTQLSISIPTTTTTTTSTTSHLHHHQLFPLFNSSNV